jgi:hypothetical protein
MDGAEIKFRVLETDLVVEFKRKIQEKTGFQANQQQLFVEGQRAWLSDYFSWGDSGVVDGSSVFLLRCNSMWEFCTKGQKGWLHHLH